jgi:outer membrane receptor protein involved in Fe transport
MFNRLTRSLLLGAIAGLVSLSALAQTTTSGVIEGRVRDQAGNPIADATVTAVANRAPTAAVTDSQGRFVIPNLPPGTYKVRAESPGKAAVIQEPIVVSINARSRVDFTLVGGQTETVTVTAEAPIVDTKSVTTGGTFKVEDFIEQLPVGRNLAATLTLAPGVESGGGTGAGNYSISGSSGLENSYVVDGVNITNTGYGGIGSYNIVFGSLGTGVTYDFLEEVQVKTGGIDVEFGQATGGVVNTVVKSGTNELSGQVSLYAGAPINEFKQTSLFVGAVNPVKGDWADNAQYDLGMSVGGPIMKDKLFYFVAYNPVKTSAAATIEPVALPTTIGVAPYNPTATYPAAAAGTQVQDRTSNNYAGKITWYANPNHRLELSAFGDPSKGDEGPQRFSLRNIDFPEGGGLSQITYGANNYTLKYDAVFTPTLFLTAQIGRHDGKFEETSSLNKSRYTDQRQLRCFLSPRLCAPGQARDNAATWAFGGVGFISNSTDVNDQFKTVLTWSHGNNEVKGGVSYDSIEYTDRQDYTGASVPLRFTIDGDGSGSIQGGAAGLAAALGNDCLTGNPTADCSILVNTRGGVRATMRATGAGLATLQWRTDRGRVSPNAGPTQTKDLAFFVQDTWTFTPKWTLKAGVRAGQQKITGSGDYSLPFTQDANGVRTLVPSTFTAGEYKFDWTLAPRVGLTWDMKGDGRSKAYVNVARYFERVPNDLAIRALSNEAGLGTTTFSSWDIDAGNPGTQTNSASIRGGQTRVEDGTKTPYVDEFVLGWQQELGRDVSYEIRGIYREQGRALEDTQFNTVEATENYYAYAYFGVQGAQIDRVPFPNDPAQFSPDGGATFLPGSPFGEYVLANPGDNTPAGFPKAVRKYYALEGILNKRFGDHWLFYGNMRFSRLRGNYEGLFRNDNGQSDPNISSLFDFPNSPLLAGQFQSGPLNTDRPFSMKLYGSYQTDIGLNFGAALNVAAGVPRTPLLAHPNGFYQNAGEVPGRNPVYYWYSASGTCAQPLCYTTGSALDFFNDTNANIPGAAWNFPHLVGYDQAARGSNGRTNTETTVDLSASWQHQFSRWATFGVGATVFNVLNSRETTLFDDNIELQAGVTDPDYLKPLAFQNPRTVRVFARWSF